MMETQREYNPSEGARMTSDGKRRDMTGYTEFRSVEGEMMTSANFGSTTGCCATGTCD